MYPEDKEAEDFEVNDIAFRQLVPQATDILFELSEDWEEDDGDKINTFPAAMVELSKNPYTTKISSSVYKMLSEELKTFGFDHCYKKYVTSSLDGFEEQFSSN